LVEAWRAAGTLAGVPAAFVPDGFDPPAGLDESGFVLEPLGPQHNAADHEAWSSSMDHIRATPGFVGRDWPHEMSLDENRADLERHARDFAARTGFTYTVLDAESRDVIGCVYIYPLPESEYDARVLSWVRESRAHLDRTLWRSVSDWIAAEWPFDNVDYAARS
jgi:hypothetical protein